MNSNITILVADDHPIMLSGLIEELRKFNYCVVSGADNGAKALDKIIDLEPQVAILDIEMPYLSGIEVIERCIEKNLPTKFIILTSHKEKGLILQTQELQIMGYLLKDEPFLEVHRCIQSIIRDVPYFSKTFNDIVSNQISPELDKIKFLSPSERTIIRLVAQDKSSKEIGIILSISNRTVEKHRANIIAKLGLDSHMDALSLWAKENKELLSKI